MSNLIIIVLAILLILSIAAVIVILSKSKNAGQGQALAVLLERLNAVGEQSKELRQLMDEKLNQTHEATRAQFGQMQQATAQSAKLISDVTEKLTKLDETNRQVINFSAQLQNLQDILKNPKQRGVLGEYFLEETLKNVLPPNSYQMQYKFADGVIVDAAVFTKETIIPIDSKFSLENYEKLVNAADDETREKYGKLFKQDLKNRIDETAKYIRPKERTTDFAMMFIPSEAIYYDLLVGRVGIDRRNLIEYAHNDKKVIIISPTTFLAYLQTILQGLKAMQIEEGAKEIRANVEKLAKHIVGYDEYMKKLGASLSTTVNQYSSAYKEFAKIDKDVVRIAGGETSIEPMLIDKPSVE